MVIRRELKNHAWVFDEETKELLINDDNEKKTIILDKVRWFSLFRFMIRASQKMSTQRRKK